ncbi:hypothetical protein Tco_1117563, partial [Tanacetum coccineum]
MSHCKKRVGDGRCTLFWEDLWITDVPLRVSFPRLYALEMNKLISVAEKLDAPISALSFRREVRGGIEQQQWSKLVELVGSVSLSSSPDRWFCGVIWMGGGFLPLRIGMFGSLNPFYRSDLIFAGGSLIASAWWRSAVMSNEKQELTGIKEVEVVVKSEVVIKSEDDKSSNDDKSLDDHTSKDSQDYMSEDSSEDLINFLSSRDLQWQFPKQSHEEDPLPVDVPMQTEKEDSLPLDVPMQTKAEEPLPPDIVYQIQEIA